MGGGGLWREKIIVSWLNAREDFCGLKFVGLVGVRYRILCFPFENDRRRGSRFVPNHSIVHGLLFCFGISAAKDTYCTYTMHLSIVSYSLRSRENIITFPRSRPFDQCRRSKL